MSTSDSTPVLWDCPQCGMQFKPDWHKRKSGKGCCSVACANRYRQKTLEDRFRDQTQKSEENGCLEWVGATADNGYGVVGNSGKKHYAHRIAWERHHGPIPDGLCICHHCDNKKCVRIDHLFLGTHADNAKDRDDKGRNNAPKGEDHGMAKLTAETVLKIREEYATGLFSQKQLAIIHGVSQGLIGMIVTRKIWKSV